jgi:hypothetical protein
LEGRFYNISKNNIKDNQLMRAMATLGSTNRIWELGSLIETILSGNYDPKYLPILGNLSDYLVKLDPALETQDGSLYMGAASNEDSQYIVLYYQRKIQSPGTITPVRGWTGLEDIVAQAPRIYNPFDVTFGKKVNRSKGDAERFEPFQYYKDPKNAFVGYRDSPTFSKAPPLFVSQSFLQSKTGRSMSTGYILGAADPNTNQVYIWDELGSLYGQDAVSEVLFHENAHLDFKDKNENWVRQYTSAHVPNARFEGPANYD